MSDSVGNFRRFAAVAGLAFLGGCAHVWVDGGGNRHVVGEFATLTPTAARDKYTRYMALLNADSKDTTLRMNLHRQYVCGLAGR